MNRFGQLDREENTKAENLVEQFYNEDAPWFRVGANTPIILDRMRQDLDCYPPSIEAVRETANLLAGKLLINSAYGEAWEQFIGAYPQYRMEANRNVAFTSLNPGEPPSLEAFATMAQQGMFTINRETRDREEAARERERRIAEITNNGTQGFTLRTPNGNKRVYNEKGAEIQFSTRSGVRRDDDGFASMSNEDVAAIHAQVMEQRRQRSLSPSELRKEINTVRSQELAKVDGTVKQQPDAYVLRHPLTGKAFADKPELVAFLRNSPNDVISKMLMKNGRVDVLAQNAMNKMLGRI